MLMFHASLTGHRGTVSRTRRPSSARRHFEGGNVRSRSARRNGSASPPGCQPAFWRGRVSSVFLAGTVGLMMVGCGQQDPSISPPVDTGSIAITSTPDSAAIILDRVATGSVTPDTVGDISPGLHWVAVAKAGFTPMPCSLQVQVSPGILSSADFNLAPVAGRPVLMESFTNTGCMPCAEANPMLYGILDELGPAQVVLMEFHPGFPSPLDPFYLAQRTLMDGRVALYGVAQAPWLVVEGIAGFQPVSREEVLAAVLAATPLNTVDLTLRGRIEGTAFSCSLGATSSTSGTYVLTVFVTDDLEEFETAPGSNGEKEFRHVVRGVLPVACGEEVALSSDPVWRVWNTTVSWRGEGESITAIAHARRPDSPGTIGLDVQPLP